MKTQKFEFARCYSSQIFPPLFNPSFPPCCSRVNEIVIFLRLKFSFELSLLNGHHFQQMNLRNKNVVTVLMKYTYLKLYQSCNSFELFSNKFFAAVSQKNVCGELLCYSYIMLWNILRELKFSN